MLPPSSYPAPYKVVFFLSFLKKVHVPVHIGIKIGTHM
jgi:hypothetical protein